jgi:hypothetical protein
VMGFKFVFVVAAVVIMRRLQRLVTAGELPAPGVLAPRPSKLLASAALLCWLGAIITGRLTAYFGPVAGFIAD